METKTLINLAHKGDKEARDTLVLNNTGLIWSIVKRFANRGHEAEDLFQIGCIGLIKAIDNFNTDYDVKFSTYAVPMITGEIKRFLRDDGLIKVSRILKELSYKAYIKNEELRVGLGRDATIAELAACLETSEEELAMAIDSGMEVESLHKPIYQSEGNEICLMDKIEEEKEQEEEIVNSIMLSQMLENITGEERKLIRLRYYANLTQTDVGRALGISQVQVSRMEKKILNKMKEQIQGN